MGCVESFSDGARDVAGVSELATSKLGGAVEDTGEELAVGACVSTVVCCSGTCTEGFVGRRLCGSSTGRLGDCGGGFRLLRRREGAAGNSDSGTEYQGSCQKKRISFDRVLGVTEFTGG